MEKNVITKICDKIWFWPMEIVEKIPYKLVRFFLLPILMIIDLPFFVLTLPFVVIAMWWDAA